MVVYHLEGVARFKDDDRRWKWNGMEMAWNGMEWKWHGMEWKWNGIPCTFVCTYCSSDLWGHLYTLVIALQLGAGAIDLGAGATIPGV